ncbi:MAG: ABC transporter permease [Chloroflexota bacterium]|nr:ABC transporter permease [Chloroflexota bacterium]
MNRYIVRRLILAVPTLIGASIVIFTLMRIVPGDVASLIVSGDAAFADPVAVAKVRQQFGLDQPLIKQYGSWVWKLLHGDLGESYWHKKRINDFIGGRITISLQLAIMATLVGVLISVPSGILSAIFQDTWLDYIVRMLSLAFLSIPHFWLGIMIILILIQLFSWSPSVKWVDFMEDPVGNLKITVWPAFVVGSGLGAVLSRLMRSSMLEVLRQDYVRTARSKGLVERVVLLRHCLKNAALPYVTFAGLSFALLMGGLLTTERVFNIPGMGSFLVTGLLNRDYPMVQSLVVTFTFTLIVINLAVDMVYSYLDPRIRYS